MLQGRVLTVVIIIMFLLSNFHYHSDKQVLEGSINNQTFNPQNISFACWYVDFIVLKLYYSGLYCIKINMSGMSTSGDDHAGFI